jgi:hypothetical protein
LKSNKFKKFSDDQILYFVDPKRLREHAAKNMTVARKIEKFYENDISKGYPDTKLVQSSISLLYKEFGIE